MEENDIIYINPTALDKPIKFTFKITEFNLKNLSLNIVETQSNDTLDQVKED